MSIVTSKLVILFVLDLILCSNGRMETLTVNETCGKYKNNLSAFLDSFENVNIVSSKGAANDFFENNLRNKFSKAVFTLNWHDNIKYGLNLILVDSLENKFPNVNVKQVNLVVFVTPIEVSKLYKVFRFFRDKNILEVYILSESNGKVLLTTYNPFTNKSCYDVSPIIISSTNFQSNATEIFKYKQKTITNFHGCPIRVGIRLSLPSAMCGDEPSNDLDCNLENLHGQEVVLMRTLSEVLNFSLKIQSFQLNESVQVFSSLIDHQLDVAVGNLFLRTLRAQIFDFSVIYCVAELAFIVPWGRPYTSFEVLSKPFHFQVWISLIAVLVSGVVVIFITEFQSTKVQNSILGSNRQSSTLNLISLTLGNPQNRLPLESSARILLMSALMFTLVMRSLYQGSVFRFLQKDLRHKQVETIDEMIDEGFTFYFFDLNTSLLMTNERIKMSMIKFYELEKQTPKIGPLQDSSFKGAYGILRSISEYFLHTKHFMFKFKVCKQNLSNMPAVLYLQKNSILTHSVDKKLRQFASAGLVDFWQNSFLSIEKRRDNSNASKVLTIKHLKGTFQILLIGCFIATFFFLAELMINVLILNLKQQ